jgi:predicted Zn-dependent protease
MRKMLFILVIMLSASQVHGKVTFQRVKNVYSYIENTAGYHIPLRYDNDPNANAYNYMGSIYITQGMLDLLSTDDEIAMLLGHELAHHANQDYRTKNSSVQELRADQHGYYYCKKSGHKNCLSFVRKMRKNFGHEPYDGVHPNWNIRYNKLKNSK